MINGIDLLFVVIGFVLLFIFIEGWNRYWTWADWDRERRLKRRYFRYEFQDDFTEISYRQYLRESEKFSV